MKRISDEEIVQAESKFIDDATKFHTNLSQEFISGKITYDEYESKSQEEWKKYYRYIADAQLAADKAELQQWKDRAALEAKRHLDHSLEHEKEIAKLKAEAKAELDKKDAEIVELKKELREWIFKAKYWHRKGDCLA